MENQDNSSNINSIHNKDSLRFSYTSIQSVYTRKLFDKAKKLAAVFSILSEILKNDQILAGKLKTQSLDLVSSLYIHDDMNSTEKNSLLKNSLKNIEILQSYLEIGYITNKISTMNMTVISKELSILHANTHSELISLQSGESRSSNDVRILNILNTKEVVYEEPVKKETGTTATKTKVASTKPKTKKKPKENQKTNLAPTSDKNKRRKKIIQTLEKIGESSMKDISTRMTNWSEKTVLRELNDLVDEGVIEKNGQKRWTKYSINK